MKYCPICRSTYTDKTLQFCLQDGSRLTEYTNKTSQMETAIIDGVKYSPDQPTEEYSPDKLTITEAQSSSEDKKNSFNANQFYKEEQSLTTNKVFSYLLILAIGVVLGVAGYYFFMPKPEAVVPSPVTEKLVTENIVYKSFEDLRRAVDENPQQYLFTTNEKADSAEEYYLLGRSYLLTGKHPEAKQAFTEAKNRLATADRVNSKILATEIAMGLAIVNSPPGTQQSFRKELPGNSGELANP